MVSEPVVEIGMQTFAHRMRPKSSVAPSKSIDFAI